MTPFQQRQIALMRQMEASLASGSSASTIVPMQTDYATDSQLALTCVSFLSKEVITTIQTSIIEPLKTLEPSYYYYPYQSLHVTIQNIRVINNPPHFGPSDIAKAKNVLIRIISKYKPFSFTFQGLLRMPTSVSLIALISSEYDSFIRDLRTDLRINGIPDDKTYFTDEMVFANTTVCRYTHQPSPEFLEKLQTLKDIYIGKFIAKEVSLVEINAGAHPSKTRVFGTYGFAQNRG